MRRTTVNYDGHTYAPDARFRIIKPGAYLDGMRPIRIGTTSGFESWRQQLEVGDVIECTGMGEGFGADPGHGVEWRTETARNQGISHLEFRPSTGGIWNYRPDPSYLEPATQEVAETNG